MRKRFNPLEEKIFNAIEAIINKQLDHGFFINMLEKLVTNKPRDSHNIAILITDQVLSIVINEKYGYIPTETFSSVTNYLDKLFIDKLSSGMHHELVNLFKELDRHVTLHPTEFQLNSLNAYINFINQHTDPTQINALIRSSAKLLRKNNLCILTKKWFLMRALARAIMNEHVLYNNNKAQQELTDEFHAYDNLVFYFQHRDKILDEQLKAEQSFKEHYSILNKFLKFTTNALKKFSYMLSIHAACTLSIFMVRIVSTAKFNDFLERNSLSQSCLTPNLQNYSVSHTITSCADFDFDAYPQEIGTLSTITPRIIALICFFFSMPKILFFKFKNNFIISKIRTAPFHKPIITPYSVAVGTRWVSNIALQCIDTFSSQGFIKWYVLRSYTPSEIIENSQKIKIVHIMALQSGSKHYNTQFILHRKYIISAFICSIIFEYVSALTFPSSSIIKIPTKSMRLFATILPYIYNINSYGAPYHPSVSKYIAFDMIRCMSSTIALSLLEVIDNVKYSNLMLACHVLATLYSDIKCGTIMEELSNNQVTITCLQHLRNSRELVNYYSTSLKYENETEEQHGNSAINCINIPDSAQILPHNTEEEQYNNPVINFINTPICDSAQIFPCKYREQHNNNNSVISSINTPIHDLTQKSSHNTEEEQYISHYIAQTSPYNQDTNITDDDCALIFDDMHYANALAPQNMRYDHSSQKRTGGSCIYNPLDIPPSHHITQINLQSYRAHSNNYKI
ncbi:Cpg1 family polymorphic protein [Candidatus Neoehrlichia procyonis]|uniref:Uncharacterized protein n=1 Tax=Candidatus Neoehrlichia procyonis str. RAC413 TaxID=1359163 RepID=A0A0F3NPI5_9RICK|nr:hypothetical protein [Candidatus Neoehrlichia lotoris]KJV69656.1 hypothetical protein NLO413_1058 [Candidatus Neoehrlichia lotoris str. RAC413]KJV69659.1 hypothetical protein NLO413_1061 [Candidatus Neoehrlichia lotoris str. RAC413]